jgi:PadR family transcriptional regulator, regulatory protein PadR
MKKRMLGAFEEEVLLVILHLEDNAYGVTIRRMWQEVMGRRISVGAIYATLDRLEQKGFIRSELGEATLERGGRAKRFYKIAAPGIQALNETRVGREKMIEGLGFRWETSRGKV